MSRHIFKYPLEVTNAQHVTFPGPDYQVLCVQVQNGQPCLWAIVEDTGQPTTATILMRGTGHTLSGSEGRYVGTFQMLDGSAVFHVFEDKP